MQIAKQKHWNKRGSSKEALINNCSVIVSVFGWNEWLLWTQLPSKLLCKFIYSGRLRRLIVLFGWFLVIVRQLGITWPVITWCIRDHRRQLLDGHLCIIIHDIRLLMPNDTGNRNTSWQLVNRSEFSDSFWGSCRTLRTAKRPCINILVYDIFIMITNKHNYKSLFYLTHR